MTLVTEYANSTTESETPMQRLDSLLDLLSDGLVVAPVMKAGVLHRGHQTRRSSAGGEASSPASYSYVFQYQV